MDQFEDRRFTSKKKKYAAVRAAALSAQRIIIKVHRGAKQTPAASLLKVEKYGMHVTLPEWLGASRALTLPHLPSV